MWNKGTLIVLMTIIVAAMTRHIEDSPIKTIQIPYEGTAASYRMANHVQKVIVPEHLEMDKSKSGRSMRMLRGLNLNVADGAYPVYYAPGQANGQFNGKIYLLK